MDPFRRGWPRWLKWPTIAIVVVICFLPDPMWWTAPPILYKSVLAGLVLLIANLLARRLESKAKTSREKEGE